MHRSGTSAITGSLAALGLELPSPDDRMVGRSDNPEHNESEQLSVLNDHLLTMFGGTWSSPPILPAGWECDPRLDPIATVGVELAANAFPTDRPVVWKDPRNCVLLPFWRRLLPRLTGAVFVWRSPLAVALSLQARDGLTLKAGCQMWERYNRDALHSLRGLNVLTINYDTVIEHPATFVDRVAGWLDAIDPTLAPDEGWHCDRARESILTDLRHHLPHDDAIPGDYRHMLDQLVAMSECPSVVQPAMDIGRNAPCWCASGSKYKHCHGAFPHDITTRRSGSATSSFAQPPSV